MNRLEELRCQINDCDNRIIEAFRQRLEAVRGVGRYKAENSLPVFQPQREQLVLDAVSCKVPELADRQPVLELYEFIMKQSRGLQSAEILGGNVALTGFMGSGKTTVGRELAQIAGYSFTDTDMLVEQKYGQTVREIFAGAGERQFRIFEKAAVETAAAMQATVVACGGGVPLDEENVKKLKQSGVVVWLRASVKTLTDRLTGDGSRPLLSGKTPAAAAALRAEREEFYRRAADIELQVNDKTPTEIAAEVFAAVAAYRRENGIS